MLNLFKKAHKKILEAHQTLKILCRAISSHIIFFWFLLISGHFQTTQKKQNWLIWSRKISCSCVVGGFFDYLKRKSFWSRSKKTLFLYKYWWASISNHVYNTILVITKIYIFLLYFPLVLLLIMRSQPTSTGWTLTSTAAFYHC